MTVDTKWHARASLYGDFSRQRFRLLILRLLTWELSSSTADIIEDIQV